MQNEKITNKEGIFLLTIFIMGSTLTLGIGGDSKNDAWIAGIIGLQMSIPIILIYSRILKLGEGKDFYDILIQTLGKIFGNIVVIIYIFYAFILGVLVLRNFGEFTNTIAIPETPMLIPMLSMGIICIIATRLGVEVQARITAFFLPILIFILFVVQLMAIPQVELDNLKPILGNGIGPVLRGGFSTFSFPFAESVLFLAIFPALKNNNKPYKKVYFTGLFIAAIIIIIISIRNIGVLGNMAPSFYFPSYAAVSKISIGNFIQRIEVTVSFVFIYGVFAKGSICLLVAAKLISKIFRLNDYRSITIQVGLLMVYFSFIIFENSMVMKYWAFKVYPYYAFPAQVIIPVIIWIVAEIKTRGKKLNKVKA